MLLTALAAMVLSQTAIADDDAGDWIDKFSLSGDLRLRYEMIDEDGEEDRNRARYRARLGFVATINDDISMTFRLATGGGNPVSTNQTAGDGFSTKDIGVDMAYIEWSATDNVHVLAGKMKNPLFRPGKNALIWDSDLTPEGVALRYESGNYFGTLIGLFVEERASSDDSMLLGVQVGLSFALGNDRLIAGGSYYDYSNTAGNEPFYNGKSKGNTLDADGNLLFDYSELELFVQYETQIGPWPLMLFGDWVQNTEIGVEDTAYAVGFTAGSAKTPGTAQFSWTYQDIEADAVIATFNDSDFGGGGTDATGHLFKGKYALRENIIVGFTYMLNDVDSNAGNEHDYSRIQIDLEFKF